MIYDDVVELVAQEVFDHAFKSRLNFKEICKHSDWSEATLHDA